MEKETKEALEAEKLLLETRLQTLPANQVDERIEIRSKLIRIITKITLLNT